MSGKLTWVASPESGRTTTTLYLTLTLLRSAYPNITSSQVGVATIPIPGVLRFGDGSVADSASPYTLRVVSVDSDYIVVTAAVPHTYPHAHHYGNPWPAAYEYCCRGRGLRNNQETPLSIRAGVDLSFSASPVLPVLSTVVFHRSDAVQEFFFTTHSSEGHPLLYAFGTPHDYRSSQSGTPQGLEIAYATGHVTWNTSHVLPGSYSVQILVVDAFTNIEVSEIQNRTEKCLDFRGVANQGP